MSSNGWETFSPQGPTSKFDKYDTELRVIVSGGKKKQVIRLTKLGMKELGQPKFVRVLTRGQNIGFMGVDKQEDAYTVMYPKKDGESHGSPFLNVQALINAYKLDNGVYDAHMESGVLVFDARSRPARL